MGRRVMVRFDRLDVHVSEDYSRGPFGLGGEPGGSAEWRLNLGVQVGDGKAPGEFMVVLWEHDGIRNDSSHPLGHEIEMRLVDGKPLVVMVFGYESDDTSANDDLPTMKRTHNPSGSWDAGASYQRSATNNFDEHFSYTIHYTIKYLDPPPPVSTTPGHGTIVLRTTYAGLWDAGGERREWRTNLTADELNRVAGELWPKGGRFVQLQPVERFGEVRYNAIFDYSGRRQLWNIDCDETHFRKTTDEAWSWARPASVQAFVRGGEVRYAVLWDAGQQGQLWHPNCSHADFLTYTGDTWSWARIKQVQPFVVDGQLRFSCLWDAGQHSQLWNPDCSIEQVLKNTGDTWSWARPFRIQPYTAADGTVRYSGLWNQGQQAQLWNFNCDEAQAWRNTTDSWSWARPTQLLSTVS